MKFLSKYSHVIYIIIILFLIVTLLVENKNINEINQEVNKLETELKEVTKQQNKDVDTEKEDDSNSDTFDEDLKWFVAKVYETNNRLQLYEDIKESVSQDVLTALLGEDLPPKENEYDEDVVLREVTDINVFGKYTSDGKFKAVLAFDVSYKFKDQEDINKVLSYIEITNKKGSWIITKFEEYQGGE